MLTAASVPFSSQLRSSNVDQVLILSPSIRLVSPTRFTDAIKTGRWERRKDWHVAKLALERN